MTRSPPPHAREEKMKMMPFKSGSLELLRPGDRPLKMSKTRNILRLKKRSSALPSSPWLGHEQEGRGGQMERQEQGKKAHGGTKWNGPWGVCGHSFF
jgi:hypothetical protein